MRDVSFAGRAMSDDEPPPDNTGHLVDAARKGDARAFGQLYLRYRPLVYGVVLGVVRGPAVEDVVQDVFLRAWRKLDTLQASAAFAGWLTTIARRAALDHVRGHWPEEPLSEMASPDDGEAAEAREALRAVEGLPAPYRHTLRLRLVDGLTGPEIAARTGLTPASVRVNLCRGMKLLRARLQRRHTHE